MLLRGLHAAVVGGTASRSSLFLVDGACPSIAAVVPTQFRDDASERRFFWIRILGPRRIHGVRASLRRSMRIALQEDRAAGSLEIAFLCVAAAIVVAGGDQSVSRRNA
jgi:hypothetical protein